MFFGWIQKTKLIVKVAGLELMTSDMTDRNSKPVELTYHSYVGETGLEPAKLSGSQNRRDTNFAALRITIIHKNSVELMIYC